MSDTIIALLSVLASAATSLVTLFLVIGTYKEKVKRHDKQLDKIDDKITDVLERLSKLEVGVAKDWDSYIKSKSPLALTEKGKALLLDSGGKEFIDKHKDALLAEVKSKQPETGYDIQEVSKNVIEAQSKTKSFNEIKEYAFKQGMKLDIIIDVLGIYLRDIVLKELNMNQNSNNE